MDTKLPEDSTPLVVEQPEIDSSKAPLEANIQEPID
jgi:hypothetical protein